jgi:hypothetical protein
MSDPISVVSPMQSRAMKLTFINGCLCCFFILFQVADGFVTQKVLSNDRNVRQLFQSKAISKDDDSDRSHLVFPGGGIFFNWQGGVISYLREQGYDLSSCSFVGSSAGSMTATFAAKGILSPMIEEWLQRLLPSSIDGIGGRLTLLVTPVPFLWEKKNISSFTDRKDLIECNLASVYLVSLECYVNEEK